MLRSTMLETALLVATAAAGLAAQEPRPALAGPTCPADAPVIGSLGFSGLSCNCTHYFDAHDTGSSFWEFRSEPVILSVSRDGPADGRLRAGDVVVAIDGHLITTAEGGRRFARLQPGVPVRLRVRRDRREVDVTITPDGECVTGTAPVAPRAELHVPREPVVAPVPRPTVPLPPVPRAAPAPNVAVEPALAPSAFHLRPRVRLGLSLSCERCSFDVSEDLTSRWSFSAPPLLETVERNGPAHRAGLRAGDRITHVDGLDITTDEAGRRFGGVQPGEPLGIRYERDGAVRETMLVPGEPRPAPPPRPARPLRPTAERAQAVEAARLAYERAVVAVRERETADRIRRVNEARSVYEAAVQASGLQSDVVRFTGLLGDALISVTGAPVTVTESETEIVIRSADITVRIRKTEGRGTGRR